MLREENKIFQFLACLSTGRSYGYICYRNNLYEIPITIQHAFHGIHGTFPIFLSKELDFVLFLT